MFQNAAPALVLLLLMVAAAWFLQRYRRHLPGIASQKGPALQLMNTLSLGPQQRVVTVQLGEGADRVCLVLGVAPGSITALHQMPLPPEVVAPVSPGAAPASGFAARLAQFTKGPHGPR
ncbi:flagellar biosynthetic protein FliO [Hydrogenophaga sp. ZJX-1]|uniref:flagellar biosynthetic protein FliO n=1 Tax=Hydrogenophaga sp. ZJX-1 TaxID=3404778 RepID=UPI003B27B4BC